MSAEDRVTIRKLQPGYRAWTKYWAAGLPEYSFNLIAGSPGGGKTTLAHQNDVRQRDR